jgi:SHS2 domain-containing protein
MSHHAVLEHTGEIVIRMEGATPAEVLIEAARALGELQAGSIAPTGERGRCEVRVEAPDREALLVEWLNEIVFRSETERWAPDAGEMLACEDTTAHAILEGPKLTAAPALVKAATHHRLVFRPGPRGWEAEVVLDV